MSEEEESEKEEQSEPSHEQSFDELDKRRASLIDISSQVMLADTQSDEANKAFIEEQPNFLPENDKQIVQNIIEQSNAEQVKQTEQPDIEPFGRQANETVAKELSSPAEVVEEPTRVEPAENIEDVAAEPANPELQDSEAMETETAEDKMEVEIEDKTDEAENQENVDKESENEAESDKSESQSENDDVETRDRLSRLGIGSEISDVGDELADEGKLIKFYNLIKSYLVTVDEAEKELDAAEVEEDSSESEGEAEDGSSSSLSDDAAEETVEEALELTNPDCETITPDLRNSLSYF